MGITLGAEVVTENSLSDYFVCVKYVNKLFALICNATVNTRM